MTENVLVTRGLSKRYGSHPAVAHADITLRKGEIYGLVGRNGAGKTTIIRMIAAQTLPSEGEVELFGVTGEKDLRQARSRMGAMVRYRAFIRISPHGRIWNITAGSVVWQEIM